jgi:peptide/nickel transport system substrate-binding protein
LLVLLATVLGVVACGGDDDQEAAEPAPEAAEPAPEPAEPAPEPAEPEPTEAPADEGAVPAACSESPTPGGSLVVGRSLETTNLNPFGIYDNGQLFAQEQIFGTLVRSDPNGTPDLVPGLADEWEVSEDGLDWTFHLRDNAMFSNGDPVTAEDVKFSLDRFADPEINTVLPNVATGYESTEIIDDQNFVVHLNQPVAAFLFYISIFPAFILPKRLLEEQGDAFFENPVGTGAFKVQEWVKGSHIIFERNPFYWEEGLPYLDELRFEFVLDDNTRLLKIQAGEVEVAEGVPFSQIQVLDEVPEIRVQIDEGVRKEPIWINHKVAPFDELNVRRALNYAIDREAINEAVYGGIGESPNHLIPLLRYNSDAVPVFQYDPDMARELLAQSSVPDGFSTTLQFPAGVTHIKQLVTVLQQQWSEIGIDVELEEVDQSAVADRFFNFDYELTMPFAQWTSDVVVPDEFAFLFTDLSETGLEGFFSGWANQEIWDKVQVAGSASEADREELWPEIQQLWVDDMPWLVIHWLPSATAVRDTVCGVQLSKLGVYRFEHTWLPTG